MIKLIGTIVQRIVLIFLISPMAYGQEKGTNEVFEFTETIESTTSMKRVR